MTKKPNKTVEDSVPPWLREQLEGHRLDMLAFFRALDRLHLAQTCTPELHELFELNADFAEALWVLDQPVGGFDLSAITADTVGSLRAVPRALAEFLRSLSDEEQDQLAVCMKAVRESLALDDAYLQIPGRDPTAG